MSTINEAATKFKGRQGLNSRHDTQKMAMHSLIDSPANASKSVMSVDLEQKKIVIGLKEHFK